MDSGDRGMNPVALSIICLQKEYWPSWKTNQRPSVLKFCTLPTELWGSATINLDVSNRFFFFIWPRVSRRQNCRCVHIKILTLYHIIIPFFNEPFEKFKNIYWELRKCWQHFWFNPFLHNDTF